MSDRMIISVDPGASDADSAVVIAKVRDGIVHVERVASLEEIRAWVLSVAESMRPVFEAMRAQFEAACAVLRPLAELLTDYGLIAEPEFDSCHHLCVRGPDHECTGEADGTFTYRWVNAADFGADPTGATDSTSAIQAAINTVDASHGHPVPMCAPCRTAAAETNPEGIPHQFDGILATLAGEYVPSVTAGLSEPITDADANWPADASRICAHVCGCDHECDVRATTSLTYRLPSGGTRSMPICGPCHAAETAAKETANA